MKITSFSILLLLAFCIESNAQNKTSFGPKAGFQLSKFVGEKHTQYSLGAYAGGFIRYRINNVFVTELDVLYSEQGGSRVTIMEYPPEFNIPVTRETTTSSVSMKGVELPLLIIFSPWPDHTAKPHLMVGQSISVLIGAFANQSKTLEFSTEVYTPIPDPIYGELPITSTVTNYENVTAEYQQLTTSTHVGAGLEIPLNKFSLSVDLTYRIGITPVDISYNPLNKVSNSSSLTNNSIIFSLALSL